MCYAGSFTSAALTYYVYLREQDAWSRPAQLFIFLFLYVLALDSKEMAITLLVIILIYELLKAPRWADWKAFFRWSVRYATPSLVASAVTAVYVYGKIYGTGFPDNDWILIGRCIHGINSSHPMQSSSMSYSLQTMQLLQRALLILWAAVFIYGVLPSGPYGSTYGRSGWSQFLCR